MSQVLGFLVLVGCVGLLLSKIASEIRRIYRDRRILRVERIAVEEFRANRPVDRAAIVRELVGDLTPSFRSQLPAKADRIRFTRRTIGCVRIASAMSPCDGAGSPERAQ